MSNRIHIHIFENLQTKTAYTALVLKDEKFKIEFISYKSLTTDVNEIWIAKTNYLQEDFHPYNPFILNRIINQLLYNADAKNYRMRKFDSNECSISLLNSEIKDYSGKFF